MIDDNAIEWRTRAACLGTVDVNDFHPTRLSGGRQPNYPPHVRNICNECPVQPACLEDALHGEAHSGYPVMGYRGGHTPEERLVLLRQRGARGLGRDAERARQNERRRLLKAARSYGTPTHQIADAYGITVRTVVRATAAR